MTHPKHSPWRMEKGSNGEVFIVHDLAEHMKGVRIASVLGPVDGSDGAEARANLILRAVNSHEELVGALESVVLMEKSYNRNAAILKDALQKMGMNYSWLQSWETKFKAARSALDKLKAEGRTE